MVQTVIRSCSCGVLDALDWAVVITSVDLRHVLHHNTAARTILPAGELPDELRLAAEAYVASRRATGRPPPALPLDVGGRKIFLRVRSLPGEPPAEALFLHEQVARGPDEFQLLNARFGLSHREYDVLVHLRMGKTNKAIARELGVATGTVGRHIQRLLERLGASNRTEIVSMVERLKRHRF